MSFFDRFLRFTDMSVLVEAFSVVIRKASLESSYPGGLGGFLARTMRHSAEHRYICMDQHLVCMSFFSPDAAERAIVPLVNAGMIDVIDDEFISVAIVDQRYGPTLLCRWLSWKRNQDGFTSAWLAGKTVGDLATPDGWTPDQSLNLQRVDIRNFPDRAMRLAEEDGMETWLDFNTGRITRRLVG